MKFTPIEISQNVNFFSLRMYCSEVHQDHNLRTYKLFDLLEKYLRYLGVNRIAFSYP